MAWQRCQATLGLAFNTLVLRQRLLGWCHPLSTCLVLQAVLALSPTGSYDRVFIGKLRHAPGLNRHTTDGTGSSHTEVGGAGR